MCCTECTNRTGTTGYAYNQCSPREENKVQHKLAPYHLLFWLSEVQFRLRNRYCAGLFCSLRGRQSSACYKRRDFPAWVSLIGLDRYFVKGCSGWSRMDTVPVLMCCTLFPSLWEHWLLCITSRYKVGSLPHCS